MRMLQLLAAMSSLLAACSAPSDPALLAPAETGLFVAVHLPVALEPLQREQQFADPLHATLQALALGEVTGGGTELGPRKPDGTHDVLSADMDIDLVDAERGLPALRAELKKLKAPQGTSLQYQGKDGKQVKESLW